MTAKTEKKTASTEERLAAIIALMKANGWTLPAVLDEPEEGE